MISQIRYRFQTANGCWKISNPAIVTIDATSGPSRATGAVLVHRRVSFALRALVSLHEAFVATDCNVN